MDIDPNISNWIADFLLRQPLDDTTLNSLLRTLPLRNTDPTIQKLILLRKLESEASRNAISESTLELFEQLEEIEYRQGNRPAVSDAMKRAYCAVAVACTVELSETGGGCEKKKSRNFKFFEAVRRLWRGRIGRMGKEGLYSDELWGWKEEMEAAVWEDGGCERVVVKRRCEGVDAVGAVDDYVRGERERMGPSFLELAAARVKEEDGDVKGIVGHVESGGDRVAGKEVVLCRVDGVMDVGSGEDEMPKKEIQLSRKLVGLACPRELASRSPKRAKIVDPDEMTIGFPSHYDLPCSIQVNKVREALVSSSLELQAIVKDPLPDALRIAEAISGVAKESKDYNPVEENHVEPNLFIMDNAGVEQGTNPNVSNVHGPSLMKRNSSAHTYEWDGSQEDPACRGRLQLPSPRLMDNSPLKRYEIKNLKTRRKRMKWSLLEEDTLRTGVQKYGKGNWKVILTAYRDIFDDRTDGDLKDKWRNMTRQ